MGMQTLFGNVASLFQTYYIQYITVYILEALIMKRNVSTASAFFFKVNKHIDYKVSNFEFALK